MLLLSFPAFAGTVEIKEVSKPACVFDKEPISCGLVQALAQKYLAEEMKKEIRFTTKFKLKEI